MDEYLVLFFSLSPPAQATSCAGLNDKFFLACSTQMCEVSFRAREFKSMGACTFQITVESVPPDVQSVLLSQLSAIERPGLYEVTLIHRYYGKAPITDTDLAQAFSAEPWRAPRVMVKNLAQSTNLSALRDEWEGRAARQRWVFAASWLIEFALLVAVLFVIYRTTMTFRERLHSEKGAVLLKPVGLQLAVLAFAASGFSASGPPMLFGIGAPVLLVILPYELLIYLYVRHVKRLVSTWTAK